MDKVMSLGGVVLPICEPMPLGVLGEPFDAEDWIFEVKHDGFRSLAYIAEGECRLVSKKGTIFKSFPRLPLRLAAAIPGPVIIDGEIACFDLEGKPRFYELMTSNVTQHFYAFDLLWHNGEDLREKPLLTRKNRLRNLLDGVPGVVYLDHVVGFGTSLFREVCDEDMEGMIAKRIDGLYTPDATTWVKIDNPHYSNREANATRMESSA